MTVKKTISTALKGDDDILLTEQGVDKQSKKLTLSAMEKKTDVYC